MTKKIMFLLAISGMMININASSYEELGKLVRKEGKLLYSDNYNEKNDVKIRVKGANQPYTINKIDFANDGNGGKCGLVDVVAKHGFEICVAPRTNEIPKALWGNSGPGLAGTFIYPSLNFKIDPAYGYVVSVKVRSEYVNEKQPLRLVIETVHDNGNKKSYNEITLNHWISKPTNGEWVTIEQELSSTILRKLQASGADSGEVVINSFFLKTFLIAKEHFSFEFDDFEFWQIPKKLVDEYNQLEKDNLPGKNYNFNYISKAQDTFVWGAYGGISDMGKQWHTKLQGRQAFNEWNKKVMPLALLDLKRHYANYFCNGGGLLFATEGEDAYTNIKNMLDLCEKYNFKFAPSIYITQHYTKNQPYKVHLAAMEKYANMFKNHPALLANLLVDEPDRANVDDFYKGKQTLEKIMPDIPSICCLNSINSISTFIPKLPLAQIDFYPIAPDKNYDRGPWAVCESIKYAKELNPEATIWLVAQAFGALGSWRAPILGEMKLQFYGGLAEGATGFAPYAYMQGARWINPEYYESGNLIDPFGNPTALYDWMKEKGIFFRSVGTLLINSKLSEVKLSSNPERTVKNPNGRTYPEIGIAVRCSAKNNNIRYVVVYNNNPYGSSSGIIKNLELKKNESILDLENLVKVKSISVNLLPGDGKVFAIASEAELADIMNTMLNSEFNLRKELLELEIKHSTRMGVDVKSIETGLENAMVIFGKNEKSKAIAEVKVLLAQIEKLNLADEKYGKVLALDLKCRKMLGDINTKLKQDFVKLDKKDFSIEPTLSKCNNIKKLGGRYIDLTLKLFHDGPNGLLESYEQLENDLKNSEF